MTPDDLWRFLPLGYLLTVIVEAPILLLGLSPQHTIKRRLFAGFWLTGCTYPVVVLVLPLLFEPGSRAAYLIVAETFAPLAECLLFWAAFLAGKEISSVSRWRDFGVIIAANLASFAAGEVLNAYDWFGLLG